jgi:hypothetical protein
MYGEKMLTALSIIYSTFVLVQDRLSGEMSRGVFTVQGFFDWKDLRLAGRKWKMSLQ